MKTRLTVMLLTFTGLMILAGQILGGSSAAPADDHVNPHYKGGSTFNLVNAGPNVARCGAFPENIELSFEGSGIDTEGGYNTAVSLPAPTPDNMSSTCKRPIVCATGDHVFIEGDPFVLCLTPPSAPRECSGVLSVSLVDRKGRGGDGQRTFPLASNLTRVTGQRRRRVGFAGVIRCCRTVKPPV